MSISIEETKELSKLCQLEFSQEELKNIRNQINNILLEVKKIEEFEESYESCPSTNKPQTRKDEIRSTLNKRDAFRNTKNQREGYFTIKKV